MQKINPIRRGKMDAFALLLISTVLWGIWGAANKLAVDRAHPFSIQWMYAIPYVLFIPVWYFMSRQAAPQEGFDPRAFLWAVVASLSSIGAVLLFFFAVQSVPASNAAAVTSAYPLVTLAIALITKQETLTPLKVIGILLIIAGVVALQWSKG